MPKMAFRVFAFNICFVLAFASDVAVDVTRGSLAGDDECSEDDKQCALNMLQLQQTQSDDSRICRMSALYLPFYCKWNCENVCSVDTILQYFFLWPGKFRIARYNKWIRKFFTRVMQDFESALRTPKGQKRRKMEQLVLALKMVKILVPVTIQCLMAIWQPVATIVPIASWDGQAPTWLWLDIAVQLAWKASMVET